MSTVDEEIQELVDHLVPTPIVEQVHGHSHSTFRPSLTFGAVETQSLGEAEEHCVCGMVFTEAYAATLDRVQEAANLHYAATAIPQPALTDSAAALAVMQQLVESLEDVGDYLLTSLPTNTPEWMAIVSDHIRKSDAALLAYHGWATTVENATAKN
jgi:hypothetical protein